MPDNIITHPIADNKLLIKDEKTGKVEEYTCFGATKIIVGVENPERREILRDKETGLNYSRNAVEAVEIYNLKTQRHRPWFMLELATGKHGWYPGCEIHGEIVGENIPVKESPSDTANTLRYLSKASVIVLEIETIDQEPYDKGWYKILYDVQGYVKKEFITNLRYADPNRV